MKTGSSSVSRDKATLLHALSIFEIPILKEHRNSIFVGMDFEIEIEGNGLYKLSQDGFIIAPYDNLDELCRMIKMG